MALYRATQDKCYLDAGERCVDYLTFSQCCWNPHFIYTSLPVGGITADNAGIANFLDVRQCEVVASLAWYGRTLVLQDLLERAVAATRPSVMLINHPRHQDANNIYRHTNLYPVGLGQENNDHVGHPQSAMRTHPSRASLGGVHRLGRSPPATGRRLILCHAGIQFRPLHRPAFHHYDDVQ